MSHPHVGAVKTFLLSAHFSEARMVMPTHRRLVDTSNAKFARLEQADCFTAIRVKSTGLLSNTILMRCWNTSFSKSESLLCLVSHFGRHISLPQSRLRYHRPKWIRRQPTPLVLSLEPSLLAYASGASKIDQVASSHEGIAEEVGLILRGFDLLVFVPELLRERELLQSSGPTTGNIHRYSRALECGNRLQTVG